ncbi:MAG: serine/threonine-protein kinase [Planctomycetes bacterium]|nr:serine/threonine-protein kinase [Planctomycetota bacterium]
MRRFWVARSSSLARGATPNPTGDVAIKVLPEDVARDPERLGRFEREAKLLATLHHANVAAVYGLEEVDGVRYLVLEYIEGEDLADILMRGPVPVDDALPIARQIAEAMEAAHAKGVIHRDLKPANIKITADGTAKALDFGLAKALHEEVTTASGLVTSPTVVAVTSPTNASVILGTAGYISPEQARGKTVDRRTDIWILERQRDILRPLTFDPADDEQPVWSPDERWIVFGSDRDNEHDVPNLFRVHADFTGTPQRLTTSEYPHIPNGISPDGSLLVYMEVHPESEGDLYILHLDETGVVGEREVLANRPVWEWGATFSPDGRWLAYSSVDSGRAEIHVRQVSGSSAPVQVSTEGGFTVQWSPVKDRLFYASVDEMHSVAYAVKDNALTPSLPELLFSLDDSRRWSRFNVSADGQRFCWLEPKDDDGRPDQPVFVLNWFEELKNRVPIQAR